MTGDVRIPYSAFHVAGKNWPERHFRFKAGSTTYSVVLVVTARASWWKMISRSDEKSVYRSVEKIEYVAAPGRILPEIGVELLINDLQPWLQNDLPAFHDELVANELFDLLTLLRAQTISLDGKEYFGHELELKYFHYSLKL